MEESGEQIVVKYGRVGSSETIQTYPISKWNRLYNSKVKKGYKDVTHLRVENKSIDFSSISNDEISALVARLQSFANNSVSSNYTVESNAVTEQQVEEAQKIIDKLCVFAASTTVHTDRFNDNLLELFQIIPRRMYRVDEHLFRAGSEANLIVAKEQATLDVMKGQVRVNAAKEKNTEGNQKTILEAMGLELDFVTDEDVELIKSNLGDVESHYKNAYRIKNLRCQENYDNWIEKANHKESKLFWHGSKNENWWSILDSGLVLRPTNAVITGKMFGYGLYFADKARKSFNYTSYRNSYWAKGSSDIAFMCLYDVHLGNWMHVKKHQRWMKELTEERLKQKGDYDSLFAEGGYDLRNNEYIIYNQNQCAPRYLVEFK
jgi:poly [ADP-ribose] polymerase